MTASKIIQPSVIAAAIAVAMIPAQVRGKVDFNRDIKPILSNKCFTCHGPDQDERKAGLRLDLRDGAVGTDAKKSVIVEGKPELSELIRRVTTSDEDDIMPPADQGKRLTAREVRLLDGWISDGAKYDAHWSYTQVQRPDAPVSSDSKWARGEIDQFILRSLRARSLTPSPEADRWTLARRAAVDL
ncbi:MAG: c-type cytochrome domain-containing protein, partial [Limisphaerales bacterium]